jgi:hypothetical protein
MPSPIFASTSAARSRAAGARARSLRPTSLRHAAGVGLPALVALGLLVPSGAQAAITTFGSNLSAPATANTSDDLNYSGTNTPTIVNGAGVVVHTGHDGADTALWNTALASGSPTAPSGGQITQVKVKGCAEPAAGGPAPLTQIHFQALQAAGGGSFRVQVTTNPFNLPVCGQNGDATTVTTFNPVNFCVNAGDYVDFNDEGGFDPNYYRAGVPYLVMAHVPGSSMDSFIRGGGTNNGATFSPSDTSSHDGFAQNSNEELLLQATLATGPDATPLCPGGTAGEPAGGAKVAAKPKARASIPRQTDGASHGGVVSVAVSCHTTSVACRGTVTLRIAKTSRSGSFNLPSGRTGHVRLRFGKALTRLLHKGHGRATARATVTLNNGSSAAALVKITGGR